MEAQGNAVAHLIANHAHQCETQWPIGLLPGEPWRLSIHGQPLGGNVLQQVQESITTPRAKRKWIDVLSIPPEVVDKCMWHLFF